MAWRDTEEEADDLGASEDPDESDQDPPPDRRGVWRGWSEDPAVVPCPECGMDVSEEAIRCPHCGDYISTDSVPLSRQGWVIAIVFILIAVMVAGIFLGR